MSRQNCSNPLGATPFLFGKVQSKSILGIQDPILELSGFPWTPPGLLKSLKIEKRLPGYTVARVRKEDWKKVRAGLTQNLPD